MCGRFTLTVDPADLQSAFPEFSFPERYAPRYNIAPTQPILAVPNNTEGNSDFFIWGLVPSWAKDPAIGNRMINARAETLAEKPSFRGPYRHRRCLIFADGFYEWKAHSGTKKKTPYYIRLNSGKPFAFAGLWEGWQSPDGGEIKSATIITTQPNLVIAELHNRMPVILDPNDYAVWLDPAPQSPADMQSLLRPYSGGEMIAYPVSTIVNSPANNYEECILPA